MESRILVTGVGGSVGGIGLQIVHNLSDHGHPVRALLRSPKPDLEAELRDRGVEVFFGDLTELKDVQRAIRGCKRVYFGLGTSEKYLEATANTAAVARSYDLECFVNISQMTVSQMSLTETTSSHQHKLQWLSEQVLNWSGLPVVQMRATVFLEHPFFSQFAAESIRRYGEIRLPFGKGRTSPIASSDVARVATEILLHPEKYIGRVCELTGPKSENLEEVAKEYSEALGREIRYVDVSFEDWKEDLSHKGLPEYLYHHFLTMAELHAHDRYDRQTDDVRKITGRSPLSIREWVRSKPAIFKAA